MQKILASLHRLIALLRKLKEAQEEKPDAVPDHTKDRVALYKQALSYIGTDASSKDLVHDDLGCAESVSRIIRDVVDFPIITGTWTLFDHLSRDPRFVRTTLNAGPGTIIISPTGTGNGYIRGHTGILGKKEIIMSADSTDGVWRESYTIHLWEKRWGMRGGFPTYFFVLK